MSNERFERLREAGWHRPLTEAERAELAGLLAKQPEGRADWEAEVCLNEALRRLPDAPVASNFTANVLQEIEREGAARERAGSLVWHGLDLRRWMPRLGLGLLAAGAVLVSVHSYSVVSRAKLGESVVVLSEVTPAPSPDLLADFESIRKLSSSQGADTELLDLLR